MRHTVFMNFDICYRMVPLQMLHSTTFTYFILSNISNVNISGNGECWRINVKYDFYRFCDLPSNGNESEVELCDLDLHFQGQHCEQSRLLMQICLHLYGTRRRVAVVLKQA